MKLKLKKTLIGLIFGLFTQNAVAEIQLNGWKQYASLAEQGAICASFAALMESQSLLNQDMGVLWQERRKFAGAVIGRAVMMELQRQASEQEIEDFIRGYRDWVLSTLLLPEEEGEEKAPSDKKNTDKLSLGQERMTQLIGTQCALLFQQGDAQIKQRFPKLAYLMDSQKQTPESKKDDSSAKTASSPENPIARKTENNSLDLAQLPKATQPAQTSQADKPEQQNKPENPTGKKQNKSISLALGGGRSFTLMMPPSSVAGQTPSMPIQTPVSRPPQTASKSASNLVPSVPIPKPVQDQKNTEAEKASEQKNVPDSTAETKPAEDKRFIQATDLIVPVKLLRNVQDREKVQLTFSEFSTFDKAEQSRTALQRRFPTLFKKYMLQISVHEFSSGSKSYSVDSANINLPVALQICTLLWTHQLNCLVKNAFSR